MLAFDVSVNGARLCRVGTESNDVVSTIVSWASGMPDLINFHVGGIASGGSQDHVDWETPSLSIGDAITIRIMDSDTCDEPDWQGKPANRPSADKNA